MEHQIGWRYQPYRPAINAFNLRYTCSYCFNLCTSGLQGLFFYLICKRFVLTDEKKINLSIANRSFNSSNYTEFYEKYFLMYETLRTDIDQKKLSKMHIKIYLNLQHVKNNSHLGLKPCGINIVILRLFVPKALLKRSRLVFRYLYCTATSFMYAWMHMNFLFHVTFIILTKEDHISWSQNNTHHINFLL